MPRSKNRLDSFRYAFAGVAYAWRTQGNLRIHLLAGAMAILLGVVLPVEPVEVVLLVVVVALVLIAELVNTAVEAAVDVAAPHFDPLARVAKDVCAAAVLVAAASAAITGMLIFGPRLMALVTG